MHHSLTLGLSVSTHIKDDVQGHSVIGVEVCIELVDVQDVEPLGIRGVSCRGGEMAEQIRTLVNMEPVCSTESHCMVYSICPALGSQVTHLSS